MRRRTVVAALAGLATFAAAAVGTPAVPAGAQVDGTAAALVGNFVGGPEDELFLYDSLGEDLLVTFTNGGVPGGDVFPETFPFRVTGTYSPVAGDFDGDGYDEIFWYAPGAARDSRWDFTSTSTVTSTPYTVNGSGYWPQAGNFLGDGTDDILWYGPGPVADSLWDFDAGGAFRSVPQQISGDYWPLVGSYGTDATDDVFWWGPGTVADSLWDFRPNGSRTSTPYTVNGDAYFPFSLDVYDQGFGGGDLFWYLPGAGRDILWDFLGGVRRQSVQTVNGDYYPVAGNFLGDGCDDILWFGITTLGMWDYSCTPGGGARRYVYDLASAAAATAAPAGGGDPAPSAAVIRAAPHRAAAAPS